MAQKRNSQSSTQMHPETNGGHLLIGLDQKARRSVVDRLHRTLADEYVLYTKTKMYSWNVTGPSYRTYKDVFRTQTKSLDDFIHDVASRIRVLGGVAIGTLKFCIENARLTEDESAPMTPEGMVTNALSDHESLVRHLRADVTEVGDEAHDEVTKSFLIDLMARHEKMAATLRNFTAPSQ